MTKWLAFLLLLPWAVSAQTCVTPCRINPAWTNGSGVAHDILATFLGSDNTLYLGYGTDTTNYPYGVSLSGYPSGVRDPSIIKIGGTWYVAYTPVAPGSFWGLTSSTDLINWTTQTNVSVTAAVPGATFVWAPRWFTDTDGSLHITVGISTDASTPLPGGNFNIYEMHQTGTFGIGGTWSTPVLMAVTGETNIIDPQVTCKASGNVPCTNATSGNTYFLWYTTCCFGGGTLHEFSQYASATSLTGTYTDVKTGDWAGWGCNPTNQTGCEGVQLLYMGSGNWRSVFDYVPNAGALSNGQLYFSDSSDGWTTWSAKQPLAVGPPNTVVKHGTVYPFP